MNKVPTHHTSLASKITALILFLASIAVICGIVGEEIRKLPPPSGCKDQRIKGYKPIEGSAAAIPIIVCHDKEKRQ